MAARVKGGAAHGAEWQLQEAKNGFCEVVRRARSSGPQVVTVHGRPAAVVVSYESYAELSRPRVPFVRFLAESPLKGVDLDVDRPADLGRKVDL